MPLINSFRSNLIWRGLYLISLLLLNVGIARCFEASGSGWIYFTINNLHIILLISGLSLESGITYFAVKDPEYAGKLASVAMIWSVIITLVSSIIVIYWYPVPDGWTYFDFVVRITLPYIFGALITSYFFGLFHALNDFRTPNLIMAGVNGLLLLFLPFENNPLAVFAREDYITIFFLGFALQGLILAITYLVKQKTFRFSSPDIHLMRPLLRYSLFALLANIAHFFVYRVDYLFVGKYCDEIALGNYIQVSKLGQLFLILPTIMASVIFPHVARGAELGNLFQICSRILVITFLVVIALIAAFGNTLFPYTFGNSFTGMYLPFLILLPGICFLSMNALMSAHFAGIGRVDINIKTNLVALAFMVPLDFILIPAAGIIGAALASSICYFIGFYTSYRYLNSRKEYTLQQFLIFRRRDLQNIRNLLVSPVNS